MYDLWKTQMLFLLESHDMLGIINGTGPVDDCKLWKRTNALVNGWMLGSLSEQAAIKVLNRLKSKTHFTSKDIWDEVQSIYGQRAVELTESISINGNTALHIAAVTNMKDGFLESMLDLLPANFPLRELRNSDGSILLHLAASLGKTNAARILVNRSPDLLYVQDKQGCTPLDIVLSDPRNKETCLLLWNSSMPDVEQDTTRGNEPLVNAISYGYFDLAKTMLQRYNSLKGDSVLMAIAQHCPADFKPYDTIIYKLWQTSVLDFVKTTLDMENSRIVDHGYLAFAKLILRAGSMLFLYPLKMLISIGMKLPVFNNILKEKLERRRFAREVLDTVCGLIKFSNDASSYREFYTEPILEAIRRDASDIVEKIVYWFPCAALMVDEDGNNITQSAWKQRSLKVYALIVHQNMAKYTSLSQKIDDPFGNNFLHFAARLAPARKLDLISSPPFQLQRELQWFKAAQNILPLASLEKNCFGETPEMVFTKEHKELVAESGNWMKSTANSYALTATLIITVVFAAAITVPGGNKEKDGVPHFIDHPAFIVFITSVAISMVSASMSLLLFLAILTSRYMEQEFFIILPLTLVIGLVSLFVSATFSMLAFGAALFLMFGTKYLWTLGLIAPSIGIPIFLSFCFYSVILSDFFTSVLQFFTINRFRQLKLLGQIFIQVMHSWDRNFNIRERDLRYLQLGSHA